MKKKEPAKPVTKHVVNMGVSALAREVGLTPAAISQKMKAGQTADQIRRDMAQRQGTAPKVQPSRAKVKGNSIGPGRPPIASEYDLVVKGRQRMDALDEMKFRRAKALAEHQEIDNMMKRGELLPVSYVRQWASRFLTDGRDEILKMPGELADPLAAETDPQKVAAALRAWAERVMAKFQQLEQLWGGDAAEGKVA